MTEVQGWCALILASSWMMFRCGVFNIQQFKGWAGMINAIAIICLMYSGIDNAVHLIKRVMVMVS